MIKKLSDKHRWAVIAGQQRKMNKRNVQLAGYKRKPRWRAILKAQGLHDSPFANYYSRVALEADYINPGRIRTFIEWDVKL